MDWIKKCYFYLFYKLYVWYESSTLKWWSDGKAALSISILEIMLLITSEGMLSVLFRRNLFAYVSATITIAVIIIVSNHFIFIHNDSWKPYVEKFNKLPKKRNLIGGIIVWTIVMLVFAALIFMYYLLSQVGWNK